MKNILYIGLLYICLALLMAGCSEADPQPACIQAEVVGPDPCGTGWYILEIENDVKNKSNSYVGQLQSGYVTTNTLPEEFRQAGRQFKVSLELMEEGGVICQAVYMMYPAVSVIRVCEASAELRDI